MILLDANLLLYAVNEDAMHHKKAKSWLEAQFSGTERIAFSWNVILAFLRLTTRPGLFQRPLTVNTALDIVESWLDHPGATMLHPGPQHFRILSELLRAAGTGGNLTSDAHLAVLAIEHGATLCSMDADFGRFASLQWKNPIRDGR